jgi:hypothetical protein
MKAIPGGVDRMAPANAKALHRDKYTQKISSTPMAYDDCDLSGAATNPLPGRAVAETANSKRSRGISKDQ